MSIEFMLEFMLEYWYLFAVLMVVVFLLSNDPTASKVAGAKTLTPAQLPQLQSQQQAVIVDLNEKMGFAKGHISRAINIPFNNLADSLGKLRKYQKKPIILTCETGAQSRKAVAALQKNDFTTLYVLTGGLAAWKKENLPLEKSAEKSVNTK